MNRPCGLEMSLQLFQAWGQGIALQHVCYQLGADDESLHVHQPANQKLLDEGEIFLSPSHQLANAGVMYFKTVGV